MGRLCTTAILLLATIEGSALGQDELPGSVRVLVEACDPPVPFLQSLPQQLRIELSGLGLEVQGDTEPRAEITLSVAGCAPEAETVHVRIHSPTTSRTFEDEISLEEEEPSRPLALALAERLREQWPMLSAVEEPEPPVPPSEPSLRPEEVRRIAEEAAASAVANIPEPEEPPPSPKRWQLGGAIGGRLTPELGSGVLALRVVAQTPARGLINGSLDVGGYVGGARDPLGEIDIWSIALGLSVGVAAEIERLRLGIGPRVELGWGWMRGRPRAGVMFTGLTQSSAIVSLGAQGKIELRLKGNAWIGVNVEAGWVLLGLTAEAEERAATGLAGPFVTTALTLSFGLGQ